MDPTLSPHAMAGPAGGDLSAAEPPAPGPALMPRRSWFAAPWVLFRMTLSRSLKSWKTLIIALLFSLPIVFPPLRTHYARPGSPAALRSPEWLARSEYRLIFWFIPQALLPIAALLYASGMIQDEVEEQTLTYLLVRPIPRWQIYGAKLLATSLLAILLASLFTTAAYASLHWGLPSLWEDAIPHRAWKACALFALTLVTYCSLFGFLSLVVRKALVVGVAYIFLFEGVLANIDFVVRRLTVMYYLRVLARRWLGLRSRDWSIDLSLAPSASTCVLVL